MFFDTHTHVNSEEFQEDAESVIQRSLDNRTWMVNIGTMLKTSQQAIEIADKYKEGVYASIGIHPDHSRELSFGEGADKKTFAAEFFDESVYEKLLTPKVVGVGECGLDYFRLPEGAVAEQIKQVQKIEFIKHLKFAEKHDRAVIIHSRDAYVDLLEILKAEYKGSRVIIHSFTDTWETAKKFLDMGFYIALNGILTFDKTGRLAEVAEKTPLNMLLTETDAPYLAPPPFRGKRNEPLYVQYVAQKIADIKKLPVEEVGQQTFENAKKLFRI
jgi:TatD DNase family protein